jgi:hypothetical protein
MAVGDQQVTDAIRTTTETLELARIVAVNEDVRRYKTGGG